MRENLLLFVDSNVIIITIKNQSGRELRAGLVKAILWLLRSWLFSFYAGVMIHVCRVFKKG